MLNGDVINAVGVKNMTKMTMKKNDNNENNTLSGGIRNELQEENINILFEIWDKKESYMENVSKEWNVWEIKNIKHE